MDVLYVADVSIRCGAVDGMPLLMLRNGNGIFIRLLQIMLVGLMDILGQALFQCIALLSQLQAAGWRHIPEK